MATVNSKVLINSASVALKTAAAAQALEQTVEALHTEVVQAQVMPFRTGNLQNESTFVDGSDAANGRVSLISSTPYARRLYYHPEYNFSKAENPNAGGKWLVRWAPGGADADFCTKVFKRFFNRLCGGA